MLDAELLREDAEVEAAAAFVADGVAREDGDRGLQVLVPEQGEEREAQRRIGAAGGEAAILAITDAHARFGVRRGHAIDDHLRAAVVDVMELRQHR